MRILLIYPEMPDTIYALKHFIKLTGKKAAFPPLGLMTLAAMLPPDWEKKLIDLNVQPLTEKDLAWADYVFLSAMNVQEESVRKILARCSRFSVRVVAGGPLFTHEHSFFEGVHHFILNEAELTLPPFLADLEAGHPKPLYQSNGFADVTATPVPLLDIVDMRYYVYAIVQYSRGCPYLCEFCDVTSLFGRTPRVKSPEQMIRELDAIHRDGNARMVLFADDNLIGNKRTLKTELLPALIEWRIRNRPNFIFATQLTVNLADDEELMQLLADAGFRHVFIGIETPDEESLKESRKNQNLKRDMIDTIHRIHGMGFTIAGGFITGFDTDTDRSFGNLRDFIQDCGIPLPIVNILKAPPGTALFERLKKDNRLTKRFSFEEGDTNIVPLIGEENLLRGFLEVIDGIYPPAMSLRRMHKYFDHFRPSPSRVKMKSRVNLHDLGVGLKVIFGLGIKDTNRKYFWRLIFRIILRDRKQLQRAVMCGLIMYQLSKTYGHIRNQVEKRLSCIRSEPPRADQDLVLH